MQPLRFVPAKPDPGAAARRAARRRFLGEELTPDSPAGSSWLVRAVLHGETPLEITHDGVIPHRPSGVLPLRHGLTAAGLRATCLLEDPGVARLRADADRADADVECAACRAWQAKHGITVRRTQTPVMARIRAALEEVFSNAA